jgi:hypothetical protein
MQVNTIHHITMRPAGKCGLVTIQEGGGQGRCQVILE